MTMTYRFGQPRPFDSLRSLRPGVFRTCVIAVLLATFAGGARPGWAQETAAPGVTEEGDSHGSSGKGGEGIKVHGHWTIDVRNPDGTLGAHHEFENALLPTGGWVLTHLLARQVTHRQWRIRLLGAPPPCNDLGQPTSCYLSEAGSTPPEAYGLGERFATLTLGVADDLINGSKLKLMGDFTASHDGGIVAAASDAYFVRADGQEWAETFSYRGLDTAIPVAAGQHVYVTVTFSFS